MSFTLVKYAFAALALYLAKYFLLGARKQKYPLPPGPKRRFVIGNLLDMPKDHAWIHLAKHKELYGKSMEITACPSYSNLLRIFKGPISSLSFLGQNIIVLNDESVSIDLFEKRSKIFSDRPKLTFAGKMYVKT